MDVGERDGRCCIIQQICGLSRAVCTRCHANFEDDGRSAEARRPEALNGAPEPSLTELPPLLLVGTIRGTDVNTVGSAVFISQGQCASEAHIKVVAKLFGYPRPGIQLGAGLDRPFFCKHAGLPLRIPRSIISIVDQPYSAVQLSLFRSSPF